MYQNHELHIKGSKLGYVSEKEVGTTGVPADAVIDCYNMDFFPDYDKRRNPYDIDLDVMTALTSAFPNISFTGYVLHNYTKKTFIDVNGNEKECYIAVVTKANYSTYIFIKGYYCPANTAQNYYNSTAGFNTDWINITEYYDVNTFTASGSNLTATDAYMCSQPDNFYKGFFVYAANSNVVGIVTSSTSAGGTLTIACDVEDGITLTTHGFGICRFPVNQFNFSIWSTITNVSINSEIPNVVRFACGDDSRVLWLGFIKDRKWFNKSFTPGTITYSGTSGWINGALVGNFQGETADTYYIKCDQTKPSPLPTSSHLQWKRGSGTYVDLVSSVSSDGWYTAADLASGFVAGLDLGMSITIKHGSLLAVNDTATLPLVANANSITWDGFWFEYDSPQILNKKSYTYTKVLPNDWDVFKPEIGYELGIFYDGQKHNDGTLTYYDRIYSLCVELDGFQTVFVKQILSNDQNEQYIYGRLEKWFSRRITATLLFYDEMNEVNPALLPNGILPLTYLVDDHAPGYLNINKMSAALLDRSGGAINSYRFPITTVSGSETVGTDKITKMKLYANGISLNSFLNQEYWKNITMKCDGLVKVGETMIAYGISQEITEIDANYNVGDIPKVGKNSICTAQLQNSGANTHSIMCSERINEVTREQILNVISTVNNNFLILTSQNCLWYDIYASGGVTDYKDNNLQHLGTYQNKGVVSKNAVSKAVFTDSAPIGTVSYEFGKMNFGGVFWAGYETIYGFFDNEPIDLLQGRWRKEYREVTKANKEAISSGYYPNMKDVWFTLPSYVYIFSAELKSWKKYQISNVPLRTSYDSLGQLMWMDSSKIYRIKADWEDITTGSNYKDNASGTPAAINFDWKKRLNHGNPEILKLLHRIDFFYEMVTAFSTPNYSAGTVKIAVSSDKNSGDVLNATYTLQDASPNTTYHLRVPIAVRKLCNYYSIEFYYDTATIANIISFKVNQLSLTAKLTKGTLTKA